MILWLTHILIGILLTLTPVRVTCYQLTTAQCDGDPTTGSFGKMGKYNKECALTRAAARHLHAEPGDRLFVWAGELTGVYWYNDRMPGSGYKVDLQVDGNWSGKGKVINLDWRTR